MMSEFKFACPVCGQHITADSSTSGAQLDCPTCFQKIIVPQAPASGDPKLIVTAVQVGKPRPVQSDALWQDAKPIPARRMSILAFTIWVVVIGALGGTVFAFRHEIHGFIRNQVVHRSRNRAYESQAKAAPKRSYPIPTNINWTLKIANAGIPEETAAGGLHGSGFFCERATLLGGSLTLRQGKSWPPDLGVTVKTFARQGQELSGKTIEVGPERPEPLPQITLRWKDDQEQARTRIFTSGYALKMIFGEAVDTRIPGKIFLSLPDEEKSVVAGTFDADIRKPSAPKSSQNKRP